MFMFDKFCCSYILFLGKKCLEIDMGFGFCFWYDSKFDKLGLDLI